MLKFAAGGFLILHGLVHLLYFGQSRRIVELQPGMEWPDGSWAFSRLLGNETARLVASVALVIVALAFIAAGAAILLGQPWWRQAAVGAAALAAVVFLLLWNGMLQRLDNQGGVGVLIDLAILASVLIARWPSF